jgi:hypothetical protein
VQEGVCVDDDAGEYEGADREAVAGAAHGHGADFGLLETHFVEVFADADFVEEGAFAGAAVRGRWLVRIR